MRGRECWASCQVGGRGQASCDGLLLRFAVESVTVVEGRPDVAAEGSKS